MLNCQLTEKLAPSGKIKYLLCLDNILGVELSIEVSAMLNDIFRRIISRKILSVII